MPPRSGVYYPPSGGGTYPPFGGVMCIGRQKMIIVDFDVPLRDVRGEPRGTPPPVGAPPPLAVIGTCAIK